VWPTVYIVLDTETHTPSPPHTEGRTQRNNCRHSTHHAGLSRTVTSSVDIYAQHGQYRMSMQLIALLSMNNELKLLQLI
jgi:hypothetical protein